MPSSSPNARLPIAALLAIAAAALGWLLLAFAGDHRGKAALGMSTESPVQYYVDAGKRLAWADITQLPPESWRLWSGRDFLLADRRDALWLRLTLRNPDARPVEGVLIAGYYFLERADAWVGDGQHLRSGETVPADEKALRGRDVAFPVTVPAQGTQVVWLRADNFFRTSLFPSWWPQAADYHAQQSRALLAESLYFGGLLALLGYNAILWLRLRIADIGCYVLYLACFAATMILLRAYPVALGWRLSSPALETALALLLAISGAALAQFAREFLELKTRLPAADRLARVLRIVMLVVAGGALATPWLERPHPLLAAVLGLGVVHVGLLAAAIWAWRTGIRQARFFVMAFACLFANALFFAAAWLGQTSVQDAAAMGLMLGSALEMLLLSLAVADRFVAAQRARAAAQARLMEETEQRRAVEAAYADELAVEVRERTRELEAANADQDRMLAVIGHDLRSPLTGLTQRAEQLASGSASPALLGKFAAETATLGRETLLLIEDLVLWARLRAALPAPSGRHQVSAFVAPVVALHRTLAEQRGIRLEAAMAPGLTVTTDLVLAQTLLRNLVANALRYARQRVTVVAHETPEGVSLSVADDGPGLPPAVAAAIADGTTERSGLESGLGLRLCLDVSRVLGLKLTAQPAPNGGTVFSVVFAPAPSEVIA